MRLNFSTSAVGHWLFAGGCGLTLVLAAWVRFLPVEMGANPALFRTDSAFHLRMLSYIIQDGKLPEDDPLFFREPPRKLALIGPPNLYLLTAAVFRFAQILNPGATDFTWLLLWFNALCGALPVAGCGWVMWEVSGGRRGETILAMLFCAVASPMVLRSHAGIYRHETIAISLLLTLTAILFREVRGEDRAFWNWMAAICMFLGMGFWRLFPFLAALIMLGILAAGFLPEGACRLGSMIDACALGCLAGAAAYSFYRTNLPAAALYLLPIAAMPLVKRLFRLHRADAWREALLARKAMLLAGLIALILLTSLAIPALRVRWQAVFSSAPLPLTNATLYGVLVEELTPLPLSEAFTSGFFLYLPILLAAAAFLLRGRWRPNPQQRATSVVFLICLALTVLCVRFISLAFPFLIVCLIPALFGTVTELKKRFGWMASLNSMLMVSLILVAALGLYWREDLKLAKYLLEPDRDLISALGWLKTNVPSDENMISNWSHGYEVQTFTGRRAVVDGYLEDPQNQVRILDLLRALLSTNEADLIRYMEMHRGKYLMLDRVYLFPACKRLHLPWPEWFEIQSFEGYSRLSLKTASDRNNYLKCLFDPGKLKHLQVVFNSGNYVVLRLKPTD